MILGLIVFLWLVFAYAIYVGIGFIWKPKRPTAVIGLIVGDLRTEDGTGRDHYTPRKISPLFFFTPMKISDGSVWNITHIQYRSHFGFYLAWPGEFYFYLIWHLQETEPNPNAANDPSNPTLRVPGSERGFVFRLPGWRWSAEGYVLTGGQGGGHFD